MFKCHHCGHDWNPEKRQPAYKESCEACNAYLHCCLNCRFHNPSRHNQCDIPNTDWVGDRRGANFCDEFEFRSANARSPAAHNQTRARDAVEKLLGDDAKEGNGKPKSFDDLFRA